MQNEPLFKVPGEITRMSEILDYKRSHCSHINGPVVREMRGVTFFGWPRVTRYLFHFEGDVLNDGLALDFEDDRVTGSEACQCLS